MLGPRSVSRNSNSSDTRKVQLMSKLLSRVSGELKNRGITPTPDLMDAARMELQTRWSDHGLNDREIRDLVSSLRLRSRSAMSGGPPPVMDEDKTNRSAPSKHTTATEPTNPRSLTPDALDQVAARSSGSQQALDSSASSTMATNSNLREVLLSTTRRQRQLMADAEWIKAAEQDRISGALGRRNDRLQHLDTLTKQRNRLDGQIEEHNRKKEEERQARIRAQREMDETIENVRQQNQLERNEAFNKALREKEFREAQQKELDRQREEARTEEHNEQVRHMMMISQELREARESERERKMREKSEWERVLKDNQEKLKHKSQKKQRERELDRQFQREQEEEMDKQERERAEAKARKAAKAAYFQQLANGVAKLHMSKEQDLTDKIESEYQEQLRRAREDEESRKQRNKQRLLETQQMLDRQCNAKKEERDRERREAQQLAEALRQQSQEAEHQEHLRRLAVKAEAQRMKEFLGTQLQLQHFKETKPLETSIARPQSQAKSMYSPSRYSATPKPDQF